MNKALEQYMKTAPTGRTKEDLTYAYPDTYMYTNGFSAIITNEAPDYEALATSDRGVRKQLDKLTVKLPRITLKEIKEEIKKRGARATDKLTSQRLYCVADYAVFDIFYIRDILAILGNCEVYWDGKIETLKHSGGWKVALNGLRFVSDKGEALLLPIKTKEARPSIDYPVVEEKELYFPMYTKTISNALEKMITKWDKEHYLDEQLKGHYSYEGKTYFADRFFIIEMNDRLMRESDKHYWNEVVSAHYVRDFTNELVDEKNVRIIKRIIGNFTKQEVVAKDNHVEFARFTGERGRAWAIIANRRNTNEAE